MNSINLAKARKIIRGAFAKGKEMGLQPLAIAVLDAGGNVIAFERQDGASAGRFHVAFGKAHGAVMMGIPGSKLAEMGDQRPAFAGGLSAAFDGAFLTAAGGVLVRDKKGGIIGAVGVTGDTSDNDALAGSAGVEAAGLTPDA